MNRQKEPDISAEEALTEILLKYPGAGVWNGTMDYYAYPEVFSSTAGPFRKEGGLAGQAFCTFTIEAWVDGMYAVLFCEGKIVAVVDNWKGVGTVRI